MLLLRLLVPASICDWPKDVDLRWLLSRYGRTFCERTFLGAWQSINRGDAYFNRNVTIVLYAVFNCLFYPMPYRCGISLDDSSAATVRACGGGAVEFRTRNSAVRRMCISSNSSPC